jgi:hypothetical protein
MGTYEDYDAGQYNSTDGMYTLTVNEDYYVYTGDDAIGYDDEG